jgi:phage baseplate assembly protein W
MSSPATLYNKIALKGSKNTDQNILQQYRGFSTISPDTENYALYDYQLVKQDLLNSFYIRQGERLMNPTYGCIIWDLLFEPLTDGLKNLILQNVQQIVSNEPRVRADQILVTPYESGIQIELQLTYITYNLQQSLQIKFDQANGLIAQ